MQTAIQDVEVIRADGRQTGHVQGVRVRFDGDCQIEVHAGGGGLMVRLAKDGRAVRLINDRKGCGFAMAVNLLRLHMPGSREEE